jgi:hypothetical protein
MIACAIYMPDLPLQKHLVTRDSGGTVATPPGARPPALPSLPPGTRLADRYRVVRLLGRGGMGEVYEVLDLALAIPVAPAATRTIPEQEPCRVANGGVSGSRVRSFEPELVPELVQCRQRWSGPERSRR